MVELESLPWFPVSACAETAASTVAEPPSCQHSTARPLLAPSAVGSISASLAPARASLDPFSSCHPTTTPSCAGRGCYSRMRPATTAKRHQGMSSTEPTLHTKKLKSCQTSDLEPAWDGSEAGWHRWRSSVPAACSWSVDSSGMRSASICRKRARGLSTGEHDRGAWWYGRSGGACFCSKLRDSWFQVTNVSTVADDRVVVSEMVGEGDPGYYLTAREWTPDHHQCVTAIIDNSSQA